MNAVLGKQLQGKGVGPRCKEEALNGKTGFLQIIWYKQTKEW